MNSIVLLILIINNSASVYETHSMKQCMEIKEYITPKLKEAFPNGTYGTACFYKMGSQNKRT